MSMRSIARQPLSPPRCLHPCGRRHGAASPGAHTCARGAWRAAAPSSSRRPARATLPGASGALVSHEVSRPGRRPRSPGDRGTRSGDDDRALAFAAWRGVGSVQRRSARVRSPGHRHHGPDRRPPAGRSARAHRDVPFAAHGAPTCAARSCVGRRWSPIAAYGSLRWLAGPRFAKVRVICLSTGTHAGRARAAASSGQKYLPLRRRDRDEGAIRSSAATTPGGYSRHRCSTRARPAQFRKPAGLGAPDSCQATPPRQSSLGLGPTRSRSRDARRPRGLDT